MSACGVTPHRRRTLRGRGHQQRPGNDRCGYTANPIATPSLRGGGKSDKEERPGKSDLIGGSKHYPWLAQHLHSSCKTNTTDTLDKEGLTLVTRSYANAIW